MNYAVYDIENPPEEPGPLGSLGSLGSHVPRGGGDSSTSCKGKGVIASQISSYNIYRLVENHHAINR